MGDTLRGSSTAILWLAAQKLYGIRMESVQNFRGIRFNATMNLYNIINAPTIWSDFRDSESLLRCTLAYMYLQYILTYLYCVLLGISTSFPCWQCCNNNSLLSNNGSNFNSKCPQEWLQRRLLTCKYWKWADIALTLTWDSADGYVQIRHTDITWV